MHVRFMTFRYSRALGGFDDTPLQDFLRDKEVLAFREHFFRVHEVPHVLCVITWQEPAVPAVTRPMPKQGSPGAEPGATRRERGRADLMATLDEGERLLFNSLRAWRMTKARDEGVPPYVIFTNRELVEIIRRRPDSPTALSHCPGVGAEKVRRYGAELLERLRGASAAIQREAPGTASDAGGRS